MSPHPPWFARLGQSVRLLHLSTQGRIMGAVLLILLLAFPLAGQQALHIARQNADTVLQQQATVQLTILAKSVADAAILRDYDTIQAQLKIQAMQGNLLFAEYVAPSGLTLREQAAPPHADRPVWFANLAGLHISGAQHSLVVDGQNYGYLQIQPSPHAYEDFLWHLGNRLFLLFAAALLLLGWLTHVLLRSNLKDLVRLRTTARQIEAGNYSARIPVRASSPPEIQETTQAFNYMSSALESLVTDLNEQQAALDNTAGVTETDLSGTITFANELFCITSGYTRQEIVGQNYRDLNSGWHDAAFFSHLWKTLSGGRTWRGEICNRAKDGRVFWTATTIIPIKGEDGLPLKYLTINFDITQRKLDETTLREEKERWLVTLQSINDAVVVTNAQNQVIHINPTAESMLGVSLEDAVSMPLTNLMHLDQMDGAKDGPACVLPTVQPSTTRQAPLNCTPDLGKILRLASVVRLSMAAMARVRFTCCVTRPRKNSYSTTCARWLSTTPSPHCRIVAQWRAALPAHFAPRVIRDSNMRSATSIWINSSWSTIPAAIRWATRC